MSRNRTFLRTLPVVGALALGAAFAAPGAQASFTLGQCAGGQADGRGASFQATAQSTWLTKYAIADALTTLECAGDTVTYDPAGSGAGKRAFGGNTAAGARDAAIRFIAYDEPPTVADEAQIEAGTASGTDNGVLHTIPAALGSTAIIVNLPSGCTIPASSALATTDTSGRFQVSNQTLERIFAHQLTTWSSLGITGCATNTITRVVRSSDSGTTFSLKKFFEREDSGVAPDIDWDASAVAVPNTTWPDDATAITKVATNALIASTVASTDSTIGYADLASARTSGFDQTTLDDKFWIRLKAPNATLAEPSANAVTSGTKGANCSTNQTVNAPAAPAGSTDETLANWTGVLATATAATAGYPLCVATYIGAWDDNADVYGNTAPEQSEARTVKDYLTYVVAGSTHAGQSWLLGVDYAPLPTTAPSGDSLSTIANQGVTAIDWNKP